MLEDLLEIQAYLKRKNKKKWAEKIQEVIDELDDLNDTTDSDYNYSEDEGNAVQEDLKIIDKGNGFYEVA
jgi:hypothetical protein